MSLKVCIDPGHGLPFDPGATANGVVEAELTLEVAREFAAALVATIPDVKATLTRETNELTKRLGIEDRGAIGAGDDLVISIHANASTSPKPNGLMAFFLPGSEIGEAMARAVVRLTPYTLLALRDRGRYPEQLEPTPARTETYPRVRNVLRVHRAPAILVELGFLTNEGDANALQDVDVRAQLVGALVEAVRAGAARIYTPVPKLIL